MSESETKLILIPAGATAWDAEQRVVGNTNLPVCPDAYDQVRQWAGQLKDMGVNILFSAPCGPAEETARMMAGILRVRHRTEKDLAEVNLGLWQGSFTEDLKQRHPKAYRQWQEDPASIMPPEGERLSVAQDRLEYCIHGILRKHPGQTVGIVLRPLSLSLVRSRWEGRPINDVWALGKERLTWHEYIIKTNGHPQSPNEPEGAMRG